MSMRTQVKPVGLKRTKDALQVLLGERPELIGDELLTENPIPQEKMAQVLAILSGLDKLDEYDQANIRKISLAQARQVVANVTNLTEAKAVMDKMVIILWWLVKREVGELS